TARPSLVLLDLNLPDMDGLDVARAIRKSTQTPIIMVTARQEELDCLIGLELGADDYISKPFSPREVVARVKAVLRRCMIQSHGEEIIQLGAIGIDLEARTVMLNDTLLNLTPAEYNLLVQLAGKPGKVFTRSELLQATQGACYAGYERTIDVHIKNLRQKIRQTDPDTIYIQTVTGQGYRALG
ncbi:MAG: response regulator transcription factor, partial [Anaerolineaceae bacterium]|nr:response regulator transcription factor [Anaerolineaceae bacterium]